MVVLERGTLSALLAGFFPHSRRNFIVVARDTCGLQGIFLKTIGISLGFGVCEEIGMCEEEKKVSYGEKV